MDKIKITSEQAHIIDRFLDKMVREFGNFPISHESYNHIVPCEDGREFIKGILEIFDQKRTILMDERIIIPPISHVEVSVDDSILNFIDYLGSVLAYLYKTIQKPRYTRVDLWRDEKYIGLWKWNIEEDIWAFRETKILTPIFIEPEWFYPVDVLVDGCSKAMKVNMTMERLYEEIKKNEKEDKLLYTIYKKETEEDS